MTVCLRDASLHSVLTRFLRLPVSVSVWPPTRRTTPPNCSTLALSCLEMTRMLAIWTYGQAAHDAGVGVQTLVTGHIALAWTLAWMSAVSTLSWVADVRGKSGCLVVCSAAEEGHTPEEDIHSHPGLPVVRLGLRISVAPPDIAVTCPTPARVRLRRPRPAATYSR
jgi:hypothetical protein